MVLRQVIKTVEKHKSERRRSSPTLVLHFNFHRLIYFSICHERNIILPRKMSMRNPNYKISFILVSEGRNLFGRENYPSVRGRLPAVHGVQR